MRRGLQWAGIGCGGLLAGIVLLAMIGALAGRGSSGQATPTPTIAAQAATPTVAPAATATRPEAPVAAEPTPAPPPPTEAPPPPVAEKVRVTGTAPDGLNVRAEPSSTAARVKTIRDGAELEIAGADEQANGRTWRKVRDPSDGAEGYVAAEFLVAGGGAAPPPAAEKPAAPAAPAAATPAAPAPAAAPKPAPAAVPKPAAPPAAKPAAPAGGTTCGSYANQAAAQAAYRANPAGLRRMDADDDGIACENNRPPTDFTPVRR